MSETKTGPSLGWELIFVPIALALWFIGIGIAIFARDLDLATWFIVGSIPVGGLLPLVNRITAPKRPRVLRGLSHRRNP